MTLRRVAAIVLAAGSLAAGAGTTVMAASASTVPTGSANVHHRHTCATPEPKGAHGHQCVHKAKPTHTPKPHPKHPAHPIHPAHP